MCRGAAELLKCHRGKSIGRRCAMREAFLDDLTMLSQNQCIPAASPARSCAALGGCPSACKSAAAPHSGTKPRGTRRRRSPRCQSAAACSAACRRAASRSGAGLQLLFPPTRRARPPGSTGESSSSSHRTRNQGCRSTGSCRLWDTTSVGRRMLHGYTCADVRLAACGDRPRPPASSGCCRC